MPIGSLKPLHLRPDLRIGTAKHHPIDSQQAKDDIEDHHPKEECDRDEAKQKVGDQIPIPERACHGIEVDTS